MITPRVAGAYRSGAPVTRRPWAIAGAYTYTAEDRSEETARVMAEWLGGGAAQDRS